MSPPTGTPPLRSEVNNALAQMMVTHNRHLALRPWVSTLSTTPFPALRCRASTTPDTPSPAHCLQSFIDLQSSGNTTFIFGVQHVPRTRWVQNLSIKKPSHCDRHFGVNMKHLLSKLTLVAAAASVSVAQAESFEVSDRTTLSLFGAIELKYNTADEITDTDGSTESTSAYEDNGSSIGFGAVHRFDNGMSGYVEIEFEHDANESGGEVLTDVAFAGLIGPFGEVRAGRFDNIYTEAVYDLIDPFETASLSEESVAEEDNLIAYFSPDFNGFTFELQARVRGDRETSSESNETGFAGVVKYSADRWAVHAGVDDRGAEEQEVNGEWVTEDPVYGLGVAFALTETLDAAARVAIQENLEDSAAGDETAFYGVVLNYNYGRGSIYAAAQQVDPDEGDSSTEFAAGINYDVVDNLLVYSEYGSYDPADEAVGSTDTQFEVGAIYEF